MEIDRFRNEAKILSNDTKELFLDLWDDTLFLTKLCVQSYVDTSNNIFYQLSCSMHKSIDKDTYNIYKTLFDILVRCDVDFKFDKNELSAQFEDINTFIKEMKTLKDSKKFNI